MTRISIWIIKMTYPVVRGDGHGGAHNPPGMIFGHLFSRFNGCETQIINSALNNIIRQRH